MLKALAGFVVGVLTVLVAAYFAMPHLMFNEIESPFGFEETIARIQHNITDNPELKAKGWTCRGCATRPGPCRPRVATCCRCR